MHMKMEAVLGAGAQRSGVMVDHQKHRGGAAQGQSGAEARCHGVVYTPTLPSPSIPCSQQYCGAGPTISHVRFLEASFHEQVRTVR